MSPRRSKTIVRPSGETSSDIQVPSSVVNLRARVGMSGSSVFGAVRRVVSATCWANADPATPTTNEAPTARWARRTRRDIMVAPEAVDADLPDPMRCRKWSSYHVGTGARHGHLAVRTEHVFTTEQV